MKRYLCILFLSMTGIARANTECLPVFSRTVAAENAPQIRDARYIPAAATGQKFNPVRSFKTLFSGRVIKKAAFFRPAMDRSGKVMMTVLLSIAMLGGILFGILFIGLGLTLGIPSFIPFGIILGVILVALAVWSIVSVWRKRGNDEHEQLDKRHRGRKTSR